MVLGYWLVIQLAQTGAVRKGRGCQGHQDQNAVNLSKIMPDGNMTTLWTLGLMVKVLIYGRIRKVLMVNAAYADRFLCVSTVIDHVHDGLSNSCWDT